MENLLAKELKTYKQTKPDLLRQHRDKVALFKGADLVGVFDDYDAAVAAGYAKFGNVEFLVKEILEDEPVAFVG